MDKLEDIEIQSSFLLFVTFGIMFGRHICFTQSCHDVVHKFSNL